MFELEYSDFAFMFLLVSASLFTVSQPPTAQAKAIIEGAAEKTETEMEKAAAVKENAHSVLGKVEDLKHAYEEYHNYDCCEEGKSCHFCATDSVVPMVKTLEAIVVLPDCMKKVLENKQDHKFNISVGHGLEKYEHSVTGRQLLEDKAVVGFRITMKTSRMLAKIESYFNEEDGRVKIVDVTKGQDLLTLQNLKCTARSYDPEAQKAIFVYDLNSCADVELICSVHLANQIFGY